ncbi:MAG: PAS domain S-box protein [Planctomycetaceae bacterium]|nr:PAS domain S-box protein [Planctomycetaceae bacterium]
MPFFFSPYSDVLLCALSVSFLLAGVLCFIIAKEDSLPRPLGSWKYIGAALVFLAVREWAGIYGISEPAFTSWYPVAAMLQTVASLFVLLAAGKEMRSPDRTSRISQLVAFVLLAVILIALVRPYLPGVAADPDDMPITAGFFFTTKGVFFLVCAFFFYASVKNPKPPPRSALSIIGVLCALSFLVFLCLPPGLPNLPNLYEPGENMLLSWLFTFRTGVSFAMVIMLWNYYSRSLGVIGAVRWWPLIFIFSIMVLGFVFVFIAAKVHSKVVRNNLEASAGNAARAIDPDELVAASLNRGYAHSPEAADVLFRRVRDQVYFQGYSTIRVAVDAVSAPRDGRPARALEDLRLRPDGTAWARGYRAAEEIWETDVDPDGTVISQHGVDRLEPTVFFSPIRDDTGRAIGAAVLSVSTIDMVRDTYVFKRLFLLALPLVFMIFILLLSGQQRSWLSSHTVGRAEALRLGALGRGLVGSMIVRDTVIADFNPRVTELTGFERDELLGKDVGKVFEVLNPENLPAAQDLRFGGIYGETKSIEIVVRHKDGHPVHLLVSGRRVTGTAEENTFIWDSVDITQQKTMENQVRRTRDFLQTVLDTLPVPVFVKDSRGFYQSCNRAFAKLVGVESPTDVVGRQHAAVGLGDVKPPDPHDVEVQKMMDAMCLDMDGSTLVYDITATCDSEERFLEVTKTAVGREEEGRDDRLIVGSVHDFTVRKRSEDAAKAERHFLAQLINTLPITMCFLDPNRVIRLCDTDFAREVGAADPADLVGVPYDDVAPFGPVTVERDLEVLEAKGGFTDAEFEFTKDGVTRNFIQRRTAMVSRDGEVLGLVKAFWETTALVAATKAAHKADRAKAAFLSNMSHELRTPMNGIVGMAELIIDNEQTQPVPRLYAETVIKSAKTLQMIIDEVMDVATLEDQSQRLSLNPAPFPLLPLTEDAVQIVSCIAEAWGVELSLGYDFNLQDAYRGDWRRIRQVMVQILTYCSRMTRDRRLRLEVGAGDGNNGVVIRTIFHPDDDTTAERLEAEFKHPELIGNDAAEKFNLGKLTDRIGLPLAWKLVEAMGGSLQVEGRGRMIHCEVALPLPQATLANTPVVTPDFTDVRVLVATRDSQRGEVIRNSLTYAHAHVETADSADGAVRILRDSRAAGRDYHAVILD